MSSGLWALVNAPSSAAAATVSQSVTAGDTTNLTVRLRSLTATLSGSSAGSDELVVRDGATGSGTIIWAAKLRTLAGDSKSIQLSGLDIRASLGKALTVEFVSGGGSGTDEVVSAQGDLVPSGYPPFQN